MAALGLARVRVAAAVLAVCVQWAAAEAQIVLVRRAGPALYTSFQPLRLVSTLTYGRLFLRESAVGLKEWLGLALVLAAVATFLVRRARWPPRGVVVVTRAELVPMEEALAADDDDTSLGVPEKAGIVHDDRAAGTIVVLPDEPRASSSREEATAEEHRFFFPTVFSPTNHSSAKTKKKHSSSDLRAAATLLEAAEDRSAQQDQLLRQHSRLRLIT